MYVYMYVGATECDAVIERRCRSGVAGELSSVFFSLCKWHQMCYLCVSSYIMLLISISLIT